jgi:predicted amidohydrolase YtcJ
MATNPPTGGSTGLVITDAQELSELVATAAANGVVAQIHAIGDGAVRMVLDVFERASEVRGNPPLMRRIEHAQLVDPVDVPRFGRLGVAASSQPVHLRSDAVPARVAWGARAENTFPLAGLIAGGALIPLGTDAPVEPPDPWPGIAVAVARREPTDPRDQPTGAHNAITLDRAIRAACLDPALAAGQSDLGRLLAGYRADMLIVPASPFVTEFDAADVAAIRPLATYIDGEPISN